MSSASVLQVIPVNFKDGESLWGCLPPLAELTIPPVSLVVFSLYWNTNNITYNNGNSDYQFAFLQ